VMKSITRLECQMVVKCDWRMDADGYTMFVSFF
jgi:hypothetical protein